MRSSASATRSAARTREALAAAMVEDVLAELARAELGPLVVVSGEPRALARAADAGAVTRGRRARERAVARPRSWASRERSSWGCERALLVPGDCPLMDARELDRAGRPARSRSTSRSCPTATAPARMRWRSTVGAVRAAVRARARARATSSRRRARDSIHEVVRVPSLELDVDTREDASALEAALARFPTRAPAHARGARTRRGMTLGIVAEPVAGAARGRARRRPRGARGRDAAPRSGAATSWS